MNEDASIYIEHILESIQFIEEDTKHFTKKKFLLSRTIQDAVIRRFEIIGKAIKHIPIDFRRKHAEVAWKKIAGLRDILIHEYFAVDLHLVWDFVKKTSRC